MQAGPNGDELRTARLSYEILPRGDSIVVTITGKVDLETAPRFATALDRAAQDGLRVVVDCSRLTHFDSSGLQVLIRYSRRVRRIVLVGVHRVVRTLVELVGLQTAFPMYDGLETALSFGRAGDDDMIVAR